MALLIQEKINSYSSWALWLIKEDIEMLQQQLYLSRQEKSELELIKNQQKQLEWLASRRLLKELAKKYHVRRPEIIKDANGKPHLKDSEIHISLSHSFPYAAAIIHTQKETGIDIEHSRQQLLRVQHKFLNTEEMNCAGNHPEKLCVYWTAKEALYKLYGKRGLHLTEHILIDPFELTDAGTIRGFLLANGVKQQYSLHYRQFQDLRICFSL